jgi:hypothetical protein
MSGPEDAAELHKAWKLRMAKDSKMPNVQGMSQFEK